MDKNYFSECQICLLNIEKILVQYFLHSKKLSFIFVFCSFKTYLICYPLRQFCLHYNWTLNVTVRITPKKSRQCTNRSCLCQSKSRLPCLGFFVYFSQKSTSCPRHYFNKSDTTCSTKSTVSVFCVLIAQCFGISAVAEPNLNKDIRNYIEQTCYIAVYIDIYSSMHYHHTHRQIASINQYLLGSYRPPPPPPTKMTVKLIIENCIIREAHTYVIMGTKLYSYKIGNSTIIVLV